MKNKYSSKKTYKKKGSKKDSCSCGCGACGK